MHTADGIRDGEPLLRIDPDVTGLTKFGRSTIYREIAAGRLRAVRIGRAVRVRRDDLDAWLDGHSVNVHPDSKRRNVSNGVPR